jgi:MSHA biogenesis protein MshK
MATGLRMLLTTMILCVPQIAMAEPLPDPTLPSIDLKSTAEVVAVETVPQGLQSIIISPKYRAAIISGETVRLGDKTGDSTLVEVRESSVVLQNAQGRRVVELFPKVSIKINEATQQESGAQEKASEQTSLPEQAVGGDK